jgi:hypothetical protein
VTKNGKKSILTANRRSAAARKREQTRRQDQGVRRERVQFSAAPDNPDAQLVLNHLRDLPPGKRSGTLWALAAAALRGDVFHPADVPDEEPDDLDALLANL